MNCGRKRTRSISCSNNKRKKKAFMIPSKRSFIPPTKFLLGGNIHDPLNLNGLKNEKWDSSEESKDIMYSPLSDFLLGGNINDPLNLKSIEDNEEDNNKVCPMYLKSSNTAENNSTTDVEQPQRCKLSLQVVPQIEFDSSSNIEIEHKKSVSAEPVSQCKRLDKKDKIVSPVIPQPYRPLKTMHFKHQIITPDTRKEQKTPKFNEKNGRFQYGNYNRYYGYRNAKNGIDLRLEILANHKHFFDNKDILDIGCNIGHISLIVARDFNAKSVAGIDIDRSLITVAKKNIRYYVNCTSPYSQDASQSKDTTTEVDKLDLKNKCYPVSMPILYGPVMKNSLNNERIFPKNVSFVHGNYILESDSLLQFEQPQFDTILCLSITKWLHLNWGDDGLKRAFKRMFLQLRPGGVLIVEPQSWDSYNKKKTLTETIWKNYKNIQLFPHHFDQYLLSSEVGFSRCQTLAVVNHQEKGFRRSLKVFTKSVPSKLELSTISTEPVLIPNINAQ